MAEPALCVPNESSSLGGYSAALTASSLFTSFTLGTGLMGGRTKTLSLTTSGGGLTTWTLGPGNDLETLADVASALGGFTVTPHAPYDEATDADVLRVQAAQTGTTVTLVADAECNPSSGGGGGLMRLIILTSKRRRRRKRR